MKLGPDNFNMSKHFDMEELKKNLKLHKSTERRQYLDNMNKKFRIKYSKKDKNMVDGGDDLRVNILADKKDTL